MKPYVWRGRTWRRWYVDRSHDDPNEARGTATDGYDTWREAHDAALASIVAEPS